MFPVGPRDIVAFGIKLDLGEGGVGYMVTSVDGFLSEDEGIVRANCIYYLIHLEPLENRTIFRMTQLLDP